MLSAEQCSKIFGIILGLCGIVFLISITALVVGLTIQSLRIIL